MAIKIRRKTSEKQKIRFKRKARIRSKISGSPEKPRFVVFRSNMHLYAQLVDDLKGHTLVAASTNEADLRKENGATLEGAKTVGALIAKRALAKKIAAVTFDRGGYLYHGKIKALADAAREAGLKF